MPNAASIYSQTVGRKDLLDEITPDGTIKQKEIAQKSSDDAARKSAKHSWLGSTITQELVKNLREREISSIDRAIQMAINHPTEKYAEIVALLVRVAEIREITNTVKE